MSVAQIAEARPPYVTFELRAVEDREQSLAQGRYVAKDVIVALITPQGSKDRIERVVDDWFAYLEQQVVEGRFSQEWLEGYKKKLEYWKSTKEVPLSGTPITNWAALTPAQIKAVTNARVLTIEDLAQANESSLAMIGMGARELKSRAISYLASMGDVGKVAAENQALKVEIENLKLRNETLETQVKELKAKLPPEPTTGAKPL
jgi:cell division protein FtsB